MIYLFLYLASIATCVKCVLFATAIVSFFLFVLYMESESFDRFAKTLIAATFVSIALGTFAPTDKCLYQIGAVYIGKEIISNKQLTETLGKVNTVINMHLDNQIKELQEDK